MKVHSPGRSSPMSLSQRSGGSLNKILLLLVGMSAVFSFRTRRPLDWTNNGDAGAASADKRKVPIVFPPNCTDEQRQKTQGMVRPMADTACPDATWYAPTREESQDPNTQTSLAIYIGCNKGIDALDTLRLLSQDSRYDKSSWIEALDIPGGAKGVCGAENATQPSVVHDKRQAVLHCVEAMPVNYQKLETAAKSLAWDTNYHVHHAAASDREGTIAFPNVANKPGYEAMGMEDCALKPDDGRCTTVPMTTLDNFVHSHVWKNGRRSVIDYLSIDVEGYDAAVMRGGRDTLAWVRYVEFEVHGKGDWKATTLASVVESLREQYFVCYYAGREKLWRLTDCMTGPGKSTFSNVACANLGLAPKLAAHMEEVYLKTIGYSATA